MDKPLRMDKEGICIYLAIDPNVNVTFKVTSYLIWPQSHMEYQDLYNQIVTQSNIK